MGSLTLPFNINFTETTNSGHCAVPSNTKCPDIFVFDNASLNQSFNYDGQAYFLSLFPVSGTGGINLLSNAACQAAGAAIGCFGFTTEEKKSTKLEFGLTVSSQRIVTNVPEPGTLGMMGLGLLGMGPGGLALRRRKLSVH